MSLTLYRGLTDLAGPLIPLYLARRKAKGKEDPARLDERLGRPSLRRPSGPLVWLHGASVGEAMSVLALIERLRAAWPGLGLMVTTGTVTSAALMRERLPDGVFHQYVPIDRTAYVRRFLDHWRPGLALWVESEFWPNLVCEVQRRAIPMVLLNGRMSAKSHNGWRRIPGTIATLLGGFQLCLVQDRDQVERFAALGAPAVKCLGNLKFASLPLPVDPAALDRLRAAVDERPLWLAASTHDGEEALVAMAHRRLAGDHPDLLTVIVPRHPNRGPAIAEALQAQGLRVGRRAGGDAPEAATEVYVADTVGELGLFYRLAEVVFVGGSLVPHGGHNPLEPAQLDGAVLIGPHTHNFGAMVSALRRRNACVEVADGPALAAAVARLMADPAARRRTIEAARAVADDNRGVLEAVIAELAPHLDRLQASAAGPPEPGCAVA
ncbi:MAG: 3-deoxy-D-manno-octulosonic acid transferase [Kiloniellales bacterium]